MEVARLGRPWGVRGDLVLRSHNPESDLAWARDAVWLSGEGFPRAAVDVAGWQEKGATVLVRFSGLESPEDASALTGLAVSVPRDWIGEAAAEAGEILVHDLVGMRVVDQDGRDLGAIAAVFPTASADVWVVRGERGETLIPAVQGFVLELRREERLVRVHYEEIG